MDSKSEPVFGLKKWSLCISPIRALKGGPFLRGQKWPQKLNHFFVKVRAFWRWLRYVPSAHC
jgi:hypothetical protein